MTPRGKILAFAIAVLVAGAGAWIIVTGGPDAMVLDQALDDHFGEIPDPAELEEGPPTIGLAPVFGMLLTVWGAMSALPVLVSRGAGHLVAVSLVSVLVGVLTYQVLPLEVPPRTYASAWGGIVVSWVLTLPFLGDVPQELQDEDEEVAA